MKLRDFASQLYIGPKKLTAYALNVNHPKGRHKARVFQVMLGYTSENHEGLLRQIEASALDAEATIQKVDQYGQHLRVDLIVKGISDQEATVRIGWLVVPNSDTASLSTIYVIGE
jgi:filamentous hemagglutinin